jgi:hypothetical protein
MDTVNHSIRKIEKGRLDMRRHSSRAVSVDLNGDGGEGLIQSRLESQGECLSSLSGSGSKSNSLSLVLNIIVLVQATIHHVISMRAHALGAVNIAILGVANAASDLTVVKAIVSESLLKLVELKVLIRKLGGTEGKLVDVFASSMAGAIIGARSALAALSFVTVKAFAFTTVAVAKTLAGTLSISMTSVIGGLSYANLGVVNPRKLKRANSVRAITGVEGHTQAPVIVANTEATVTFTMTTARVVASRRHGRHERKDKSSRKFHCST